MSKQSFVSAIESIVEGAGHLAAQAKEDGEALAETLRGHGLSDETIQSLGGPFRAAAQSLVRERATKIQSKYPKWSVRRCVAKAEQLEGIALVDEDFCRVSLALVAMAAAEVEQ